MSPAWSTDGVAVCGISVQVSSEHRRAIKSEVYVVNSSDLGKVLKAKGWEKSGNHCRMRHVGTHSGALSSTWEASGGGTSAKESQPMG